MVSPEDMEPTKQVMDTVSIFTVVGTIGELLPPMAALVTIVWTGIRIYETETVQRWVRKDD